MPLWEREGRTSVLNMLGGLEPSRAVNQSDGNDPVSLGLIPAAGGPAPYIPPGPPPPPPPVQQNLEQAAAEQVQMEAWNPQLSEEELRAAVSQMLPQRWINLDNGAAQLDGTSISLNAADLSRIMEVLIDALDRNMRDTITSLRIEYLHSSPAGGEAVRPTDTEAALVRQVPAEAEAAEPTTEGPPPAQNVQPVLASGPARRRRMQRVPRPGL